MPISNSRMIDSGALLVWSVANTRCPVSDASIPIEVVSLSRISPTIMMSGSARKNDFITTGKVRPALTFICTWRSPFWVISTGSSAVQILVSGRFRCLRIECRVVVLPEPVGPHTKNNPYGLLMMLFSSSRLCSVKPIFSSGIGSPAARIRMTTSSRPPEDGIVATLNSISRGANFLNLILPSCGLRFSEISRSHMILIRVTSGLR